MYAKWKLGPAGYYLGAIVFNNKTYYASGRTPDKLETNMKLCMYRNERVPFSQVHLEQSQSEELDLSKASPMFMSKYVRPKKNASTGLEHKLTVTRIGHVVNKPQPIYEHITEVDDETGELVVYELKEVARYKLKKGPNEGEQIRKIAEMTMDIIKEPKVMLNNENGYQNRNVSVTQGS